MPDDYVPEDREQVPAIKLTSFKVGHPSLPLYLRFGHIFLQNTDLEICSQSEPKGEHLRDYWVG